MPRLRQRKIARQIADTIFGGIGAITTPQNFNQLQYTIPFQTDDAYEDWSPTRPQGFYNNPFYPNLPSTPGGIPIFNTRMRDPDDDIDDRYDRFDGDLSPHRARRAAKRVLEALKQGG